jgi:hypothetical protein
MQVVELYAKVAAAAVVMMLLLWGHLTSGLSPVAGLQQGACRTSPPRHLVADRNWLPSVVSPVVAEAFSSRLLAPVRLRWAEVQAMAATARCRWLLVAQVQRGM